MAAEHAKLTEQLAESFDTKTAKRIGELARVTNALKEWENANEVCSFPSFCSTATMMNTESLIVLVSLPSSV